MVPRHVEGALVIADVLLSAADIADRTRALGAELDAAFGERDPILLGVLQGAFPFVADLSRAMTSMVEVDFVGLTRFGSGGRVSLAHDATTDLTGRHVIVVEDIVDTGLTLRSLLGLLEARQPASLSVVTLLDKVTRRIVDVPVDHVGFAIGDEYVVGYGMDWEGYSRNLPDLWTVLDLAALTADPAALDALARTSG